MDSRAFVEGSRSGGIAAQSIKLSAQDYSYIFALAGSVSIAAALGTVGVSLSVGIALAQNEIFNTVEAFLRGVSGGVVSNDGTVTVEALESATITVLALAA